MFARYELTEIAKWIIKVIATAFAFVFPFREFPPIYSTEFPYLVGRLLNRKYKLKILSLRGENSVAFVYIKCNDLSLIQNSFEPRPPPR